MSDSFQILFPKSKKGDKTTVAAEEWDKRIAPLPLAPIQSPLLSECPPQIKYDSRSRPPPLVCDPRGWVPSGSPPKETQIEAEGKEGDRLDELILSKFYNLDPVDVPEMVRPVTPVARREDILGLPRLIVGRTVPVPPTAPAAQQAHQRRRSSKKDTKKVKVKAPLITKRQPSSSTPKRAKRRRATRSSQGGGGRRKKYKKTNRKYKKKSSKKKR